MSRRKRNHVVRQAFRQDSLSRVCTMAEEDFAGAYGLTVTKTADNGPDNFYAFRNNGASVLAVAHLDTVVNRDERAALFYKTQAGPVVVSGALDDRLGAYTILELLPQLNINVDVLLTTGEEMGSSTATDFVAAKDYNWMIEFDRGCINGANEVVMYQYDDAFTRQAVRASGAAVGHGSFSDIAYLEHLGIKGFNWGVAYRDYHSVHGHAYLNEYFAMIERFRKFHAANAETVMPHEQDEDSDYQWFTSYRRGSSYRNSSYSADRAEPLGKMCWYCSAEAVDPVTGYCGECTACDDCGEFEIDCACWLPPRAGRQEAQDDGEARPRTYQEWLDANGKTGCVDSYLEWQDSHRPDTGTLTYVEWLHQQKAVTAGTPGKED